MTCKPLNAELATQFAQNGFAQIQCAAPITWQSLAQSWNALEPDQHLKDGGAYRLRRHSCFTQDLTTGALAQTPHRAHWQPTAYNALHGGYERLFAPIEPAVASDPAFTALIKDFGVFFAQCSASNEAPKQWFIEAHQFRIHTANGIGRPTPEGAHRDGVDFVVVLLINRYKVTGGETRVFAQNDTNSASFGGVRFVMTEPMTALLLNDAQVIHETTPIQPLDKALLDGYRDTLVLTYRAGGFQSA